MYPPSFDYHRAASVSEALSLLADLPDATLLAGGHALVPRLKEGRADPGAVVDVSEIPELAGIEVESDATVVGAATTYTDLLAAGSAEDGDAETAGHDGGVLETHAPSVADAIRALGDRQIRNRGTVGGNIAEAHPDSDLPAAALVADASVRIRGPDGEREDAVADVLSGSFETTIGDNEIVTSVRIPHVTAGEDVDAAAVEAGGTYVKKTHPTSGYAMVGVAARVVIEDGELASACVAANGVADTAVRLPSVERALSGLAVDGDAEDAADRIRETVADADAATDVPASSRRGDVHASADYRASVLPTYVERAVVDAVENATAGGTTGDERGGESR